MIKYSSYKIDVRWILLGMIILLSGCVSTSTSSQYQTSSEQDTAQASPLTSGMVSLTLEKNKTTAQEVLTTFGGPNVTRMNADGEEVWTYQQQAQVTTTSESSAFVTFILATNVSNQAAIQRSQRTTTLVLTFKDGILVDYRSLNTSF